MNLLFTRNKKLGSRLIRLITGDDVSHVAIEYWGMVYHMTAKGYMIQTLRKFVIHNEIVHVKYLNISPITLNERLDAAAEKHHGYDYFALIWLGVLLTAHRLTGYVITRNHWQKPWLDLCTEFVTSMIGQSADSIITPGALWRTIKDK
jgi:hypothetical protein